MAGGSKKQKQTTVWDAVQATFTTAIRHGQLPILSLFAIVALMIWRMPEEEVGKLANRILDIAISYPSIGYGWGIFSTVTAVVVVRYQRRTYTDEMKRLQSKTSKVLD